MASPSPFARFHELYGLKQCIRCGRSIEDVDHHFYCEKCWKRRKLELFAQDVDAAAAVEIAKRETR